MSLLGNAALAMWWDMASDQRAEFEDWHSHEHFNERMSIPGFRRGTRWSSAEGGEGIFQMYELDAYDVVQSPAYLERLNAPTPWSTRMMPHHRHMVRSQCRVLASAGGSVARHALTIRLSPRPGSEARLQAALSERLPTLAAQPGCVGAHLLRHETPPIAATREQQIRGNDQFADWVLVVVGYDLDALRALQAGELSSTALGDLGAENGVLGALHALCHSTTPADVAAPAKAAA
jgi:Antibiotic biosynthesis monooxygenase